MLLGVEGLGLPSRPLARPSPYFVRDLWGGGSPPTWGSGSRNMGVIFLTPVPPPTPFSICLSLSHTHFLSLKFPGSSKKQRQHLFTVRTQSRLFLEPLPGSRFLEETGQA